MKLALGDDDVAFRDGVRTFLADNLPDEISRYVRLGYGVPKPLQDEWTRTLNRQGWAAPNWPVEHGGTGWSMVRRHLFDVEMKSHHAPELQGFGFNMVGPAIIKYGTPAQQAHYLPKILNADISWCQGYSEPQAGSDLASLRCRAEIDGDDYVINGSKIWTSAAEHADHIFVLVRTDPDAKKQLGISFLLADMRTGGITVEPLLAFNGKRLWNQVFFDNVRVPRENCLGGENHGWTVAKNLLGNERLLVSRVAENKRLLSRIHEVMREEEKAHRFPDEAHANKVASLSIRLTALEYTALRLLSAFDGGGEIGAEPSMLKLQGSQLGGLGTDPSMLKLQGSQLVQDMDRALYEAIGYLGLPLDSMMRGDSAQPVGPDYCDMVASGMFHHRGYTIAGGSSEIQHNIIAQQVLGL